MRHHSDVAFSRICEDLLWNGTAANISLPVFSRCLQHTLLVWIPSAFFWLFIPLTIVNARRSRMPPLPWSYWLKAKLCLHLVLIFDVFFMLCLTVIRMRKSQMMAVWSHPPILLITMLGILCVSIYCRKRGKVTSGVIFLTFFLYGLCGLPEFYWWMLDIFHHSSHQWSSSFLRFARLGFNIVWFVVVWIQVVLHVFADENGMEVEKGDDGCQPTPEMHSSWMSRQTFSWFTNVIVRGYREPLETQHLYGLDPEMRCSQLSLRWQRLWKNGYKANKPIPKETEKKDNNNRPMEEKTLRKASIIYLLFRMFRMDILGATALKLVCDISQYSNPFLLKQLITYIEKGDAPLWHGIGISLAILLGAEARSFLTNSYFYTTMRVAQQIQSTLAAAVYRKTLRLSNSARRQKTVGEIVNLMAIDVDRFTQITPQIQLFWSSPLQIILTMLYLYSMLGYSAIAGTVVMMLFIPINMAIAKFVKKYQVQQMKQKDERSKTINEVLNGIKVVKLYAWEQPMAKKIEAIREREIAVIKRSTLIRSCADLFNNSSPFLVALLSFGTFVLSDDKNVLTPQIAFVSLTLFNQLRQPMMSVADLMRQTVQAVVSNRRLKVFLTAEELDQSAVEHDGNDLLESESLKISQASFAWDRDQTATPTLSNINAHAKRCQLVAVVGKVGAGKSSLISAILGEMEKLSGYVSMSGQVAYVPQQSWIQNQTLRQNVLLNKAYNRHSYQTIIDACALRPDLKILPLGDRTEIGEKGINLSGGQKARVSLARAVYQDADVYLLDDPLSAVDSHVIGPNGMLRNKTRILVTHGLAYLKFADLIVSLDDGKIVEMGTYDELMEKNGFFARLIEEFSAEEEDEEEEEEDRQEKAEDGAPTPTDRSRPRTISTLRQQQNQSILSRRDTQLSIKSQLSEQHAVGASNINLIVKEKAATGWVKWRIYMSYFRSMTWLMAGAFIVGMIGSQVLQVLRNVYLSNWSNKNGEGTVHEGAQWVRDQRIQLAVFAGIGLLETAAMALAIFAIVLGSVYASQNLHAPMLTAIVRSPMSFFDTTPLGRVLNRFGMDIDIVDNSLSNSLRFFNRCILQVLATIVVVLLSTPVFVVVIPPLTIIYFISMRYYIATSRQLQRLTSISRSPVYSHFAESIQGAASIRAFGLTEHFTKITEQKIDTTTRCAYLNIISQRWLAIRLEFVGNSIVFFAALFAVLSTGWMPASAGIIGLSLSYSMNITQVLNMAVRQMGELETKIVAVERIREYCELPKEPEWENDAGKHLPPNWPTDGTVRFENYAVRYRPGMDLVLKNLNLQTAPAEKIGVVGRTGAGKSTLSLALFRILEAANGRIVIDGVDIATIGLHQLRANLTIIPQDPVLFSGTLRFNLDPFNLHSDEEIWRALENANLKEFVASLASGLDQKIQEAGDNLSVGQRQLVCLARALLRPSRVLVLDEATAAVDVATDALIQRTIRSQFTKCTVITIAHRINTILDYDRVLVLDKGEVKEFDSPQRLLDNRSSLFYAMAHDAKLVSL